MPKGSAVTLWVPQLLSVNSLQYFMQIDSVQQVDLSSLQILTAKADTFDLPNRLIRSNSQEDFFATAAYLTHQTQNVPIASVTARVELSELLQKNPAMQNHFWLKLDPVNYSPGSNSLQVIQAEQLQITKEESLTLLEAFNKHFYKDGLTLHYGSSDSWYLSVVQDIDLQTTSLIDASLSASLGSYPKGNAASYWHNLMNEVQMLFYANPVNELRREKNQLEINGVWVWGEGVLDKSKLIMRPQTKVYGNNIFLHGLSQLIQAEYSKQIFPAKLVLQNGIKHHVFVLENYLDRTDYIKDEDIYNNLEKNWFKPLLDLIKSRDIASLLLVLGNTKQYHIKPKHLRRFWRFKRKLPDLIPEKQPKS